MPYTDPIKKSAWQKRHNVRRSQKRRWLRAQKEARIGFHTVKSLAWPKKKLTPSQAMWIAGVIDCEGCLVLGSYWNKHRNSYNYHVAVQVQMTDREVIDQLARWCDGPVFFYQTKNPKHKSTWEWRLAANGTRWLLPQIRKFLLIKHQQADLLLRFLTISKRGFRRAEHNPEAQAIRAEVAKLNYRGRGPRTGKATEPLLIS